jgi:hypothetical protein
MARVGGVDHAVAVIRVGIGVEHRAVRLEGLSHEGAHRGVVAVLPAPNPEGYWNHRHDLRRGRRLKVVDLGETSRGDFLAAFQGPITEAAAT